jgi:hypothetical protein
MQSVNGFIGKIGIMVEAKFYSFPNKERGWILGAVLA